MAMGDLSIAANRPGTVPTGAFRGSHTTRIVADLHQHGETEKINLGPYIRSLTTSKTIDGLAGTWSITMKQNQFIKGFDSWDQIRDNDWIRLGVQQGSKSWLIMVGLVDRVQKKTSTAGGARTDSWVISGRDMTKPLIETDLLMMPFSGYDTVLAYGSFYGAVNALQNFAGDVGPGDIVASLYNYMMRAEDESRTEGIKWWSVPQTFPATTLGSARPAADRQFSDIFDTSRLDRTLTGSFAAYGSLLAKPNEGGRVWEILRAHSNDVLNECFVDLLPPAESAGSPMAFVIGPEQTEWVLRPGLVVRERPFPSLPGSAPHRCDDNPWEKLPTTVMDISDFTSFNTARSGSERFNYFLVESSGGSSFTAMILAQAAQVSRDGLGALFDGVPAIDRESVQNHGLQRLEQTSSYLNTQGGGLDIFAGWTRLIRDWYMLNHEYRSGVVESAFILPGIRVGERLIVQNVDREGLPVEFYVEGIEHEVTVLDGGAVEHSSSVTITRGHQDPAGAIAQYVSKFTTGSVINSQTAAEVRQTLDTISDVVGGIDLPDLPPVVGEDANGDSFELPQAED